MLNVSLSTGPECSRLLTYTWCRIHFVLGQGTDQFHCSHKGRGRNTTLSNGQQSESDAPYNVTGKESSYYLYVAVLLSQIQSKKHWENTGPDEVAYAVLRRGLYVLYAF